MKKRYANCTAQNSGVILTTLTTSFVSFKDKSPTVGDVTYYGAIEEIIEVHYWGAIMQINKKRKRRSDNEKKIASELTEKKNATEKENNNASDNELQQKKNPSEKEMPVPSGRESKWQDQGCRLLIEEKGQSRRKSERNRKAETEGKGSWVGRNYIIHEEIKKKGCRGMVLSGIRKRRVEKGKDVTVRRTMRSLVNNSQKATDGVKSPPTSLKPVGRHPSPPLLPPPPLPVDLTKLERIPNNQGIGKSSTKNQSRRGPTKMNHIFTRKLEDRPIICLNYEFHPYSKKDKVVNELSSFLGTIAGLYIPLNFVNWFRVPEEEKNGWWEYVKWVYKSRVKSRYFKKFDNDMDRIIRKPAKIPLEQFMVILKYWSDEAMQEKARKNVANRKNVTDTHTVGRTSFAQLRSKMVEADGSDDDEKDRDDDGDANGGGDESDEDGAEVDSDGGDESA
ncbi:hypothetical protein AgCh_035919 [Apium graveolens]